LPLAPTLLLKFAKGVKIARQKSGLFPKWVTNFLLGGTGREGVGKGQNSFSPNKIRGLSARREFCEENIAAKNFFGEGLSPERVMCYNRDVGKRISLNTKEKTNEKTTDSNDGRCRRHLRLGRGGTDVA
jgi:hypothetical protein